MHTVHRRLPSPFVDVALCTKRISLGAEQGDITSPCLDYCGLLQRIEGLCPPPLRDAMQRRAHRLQAGFALSRLAATDALQTLNPLREDVFTGGRGDATTDWSAQLSLSHEDTIGAALAWKSHVPGSEHEVRYAVDIGDATRVLQLCQRFPQFRDRWLPQCRLDTGDVPTLENACVLAQHWSIRECCVKLLGIPGRSFTYRCVQTVPTVCHVPQETSKPLPSGKLDENVLYSAALSGLEAAEFVEHGLHPAIHVLTWLESDTTDAGTLTNRQYAVTVAWARPVLRGAQT